MKQFYSCLLLLLLAFPLFSQVKKESIVCFVNDYTDVYHLAMIIYFPLGKQETRVSDLEPGQEKEYSFPAGAEVYIIDASLERFAMSGKDIKAGGIKPSFVAAAEGGVMKYYLSSLVPRRMQNPSTNKPDASSALGKWIIDLRPSPESEPYLKDFVFTKIEGDRFEGEFYGYPFMGGYLNTRWDKVYFAFTTQDQSGTYYHSGYIWKDEVFGITLNEQREFMLPWKGVRAKK